MMSPEPLTSTMARGTLKAIELIYGLRACGVEQDIAIPQVAVIGDQSSGKSSVLEALCSVPLPRGAGLTTRCAIELRLSGIRPDVLDHASAFPTDHEQFWRGAVWTSLNSTPVHLGGKEELHDAITTSTASLVNLKKASGFSKERVVVQINATGAPDLTIIDLPGIIRTKTFGQDRSAIREVSQLIHGYAAQDRTIMLVVVPATQDVATIEALEWASRYDPQGYRTIGVITKPDLIDEGGENEVVAVLSNKRKPLKLGYVMVKNRSQREVEESLSVQEARNNEKSFFAHHPVFSRMDVSLFGAEALVRKITQVLISRVNDSLPAMRDEISRLLERTLKELEGLGNGAGDTPAEANMNLMRILFEYQTLLNESCAGRYIDKRLWDPSLRICTRVREAYDTFKESVETTRPPFEGDSKFIEEVENDIRNSRGRELPGFLNPRIFESRVARFVDDWREASHSLLLNIRNLIIEIADSIIVVLAPGFPLLRQKVREIVSEVLRSLETRTKDDISGVFAQETAQPFTMNDQFLEAVNTKRLERFDAAAVLALARSGRDNRGNVREKNVSDMLRAWYQSYYCSGSSQRLRADAEDMATMLGCYWDISAKRFIDNHVMVIDSTMIIPLSQKVHVPLNEIVMSASSSGKILENLLVEDQNILVRRESLQAQKERLEKAERLITKFYEDL